MNTLIRFAALMLLGLTGFYACKQNTASTPVPTSPVVVLPQAVPSISGVSPDKAVSSTELTITGKNLQKAEVIINGQTATVTSIDAAATSLTVVAPVFSFSTVQPINVVVSTSEGNSNTLIITAAPQAEIAQTPVPNGLIPGGPLSLTVSNVSGITGIDFMDDNNVVKATIPASNFQTSDPASSSAILGHIMIKVPVGVSAGWIRVNTDYGRGKPRSITKLYGNDAITASNVATNVPPLATGIISDSQFNPSYFFYCMPFQKGSYYSSGFAPKYVESKPIVADRVVVAFKQNSTSSNYQLYYDSLKMGGDKWYRRFGGYFDTGINGTIEFQSPYIKLLLERNSLNTGYTGSVIIKIYNPYPSKPDYPYGYDFTYVGNVLKTTDKDLFNIVAYEVTTGEVIRLCNQKGFTFGPCSDCQ